MHPSTASAEVAPLALPELPQSIGQRTALRPVRKYQNVTPNEINIRTGVDLLLAGFIELLRTSEGRRSDESRLRLNSRICAP